MIVATATRKDITLNIHTDDEPTNPRTDSEPLGHMVCWHRRYRLGDSHSWDTPMDFKNDITPHNAVILQLYLYDHSSRFISTSSFVGRAQHAEWDSGQVGFIYAMYDEIRKEFGDVSEATLDKAKNKLEAETKLYDLYLRGECYGYTVERGGREIDACWGFLDEYKQAVNNMKCNAPKDFADLFDLLHDPERAAPIKKKQAIAR